LRDGEAAPRARASLLVVWVALPCLLWIGPGSGGAAGDPGAPLSYRFVETPAGAGVHLLSADLAHVELKLLYAEDLGSSALTARQFVERSGATAVFNGPFFDLDGTPMGLLIVDGIERVPLRPVDWGVFALDDRGPSIVHTSDWKSRPEVRQAFQVGPRLVVDGAAIPLKRQIARRTALCVLADGRVEVVVAGNAIWAGDLAAFFVAQGCTSALNLDGGTSTQLYLARSGIAVDEPGGVAVPVAVGLFLDEEEVQAPDPRGCQLPRSCL